MITRSSIRASRVARAPAAGLVAVLALAVGGSAAWPAPLDILGSHISGVPSGDTIPADFMAPRGIELPTPHRDRGPTGQGRSGPATRVVGVAHPAVLAHLGMPPEDDASRGLARAGRHSAPGTGPPRLS
jgi:hypothetical protein